MIESPAIAIAEPQLRSARAERWPVLLITLIGLLLAAFIALLKIKALFAWRYTSDLFTIDLMLQETLKGHFALEYTYGRQLGDHACLILLGLLPFKWLLGQHMVILLILLPPIVFAVCGIILFRAISSIAGARWAVFVTLLYFLSMGAIRGPFEFAYGFHIDTISGFIAVAMAALLLRHDAQPSRSKVGVIAMACLFALLKEEMALLGIGFFLVLLVLRRNRLHLVGFLLSLGIFVAQMTIIHVSRCPWNRTNEALVQVLLNQIRRHGFFGFFFAPEKAGYWLAIASLLILIVGCAMMSRRPSPYAIALALMGLAKLVFSWFVNDFDLWTWHNYPAVVMLNGALALQALELRHLAQTPDAVKLRRATAALLALSLVWFIGTEIPFSIRQFRATAQARERNAPFKASMADVVKQVDRDRVVAIPRYASIEWTDGYRYTFFPKGITESPKGIADYLVVAKNNPRIKDDELRAFKLVYQNRRYRLYGRKSYLPGEQESRELWLQWFGRTSIGPREKPTKRPTTSPAS
jgi:hypothetical protein